MTKFVSPEFYLRAFNCPHCGAYANMYWSYTQNRFGQYGERTPIHESRCAHCKADCFSLKTADGEDDDPGEGILLIPAGSVAPMPHPDMPEDVKIDYLEARSIVNNSPRGATALLRLSIQKLCVHLGESGKNINDDIGNLVKKGLPVEIQQALDIVRVVGNNAVHPGELSEEDVTDIAIALFHLVNEIVEDRIAKPKKLKALLDRLPKGANKAIEKRDRKTVAHLTMAIHPIATLRVISSLCLKYIR